MQPNDPDLAIFSTGELFAWTVEEIETGLAAGDDIEAPAAPFHIARLLFDEIVRREPGFDFAEISEFRTILDRALRGENRLIRGAPARG
jgi:hypothetical protein